MDEVLAKIEEDTRLEGFSSGTIISIRYAKRPDTDRISTSGHRCMIFIVLHVK
ncbi:MAG: hypothetical protein K0S01_3487 [Herbinix sp.]|jgi:hypothetical protein|nr:hypothetical protein [Herbinix sp.]